MCILCWKELIGNYFSAPVLSKSRFHCQKTWQMHWFNSHVSIKTVTLWWNCKYDLESLWRAVVFTSLSSARLLLFLSFHSRVKEIKIQQHSDPLREAKVMHPESAIWAIPHAESTFIRLDLSGPWPGWRMSLRMTLWAVLCEEISKRTCIWCQGHFAKWAVRAD